VDILLLIALNLFSVPFLQEAEFLGRSTGRFPKAHRIIGLRRVTAFSWFKPFCALATLFVVAVLLAMMTSHTPVDVALLAFNFFVMQAVLWAAVALNVFKHRSKQIEHDVAESTPVPSPQYVKPTVQTPHQL